MIKLSIEKLAESIGYDIGMSDDQTQSALLNGFAKALYNSMQENKRQAQCCYIVNRLDNSAKELIKDLMAFVVLDEKNPNNK